MITPERINFITNRIALSLKEIIDVDEQRRRAVRSAVEKGFELLDGMREDIKRTLTSRGLREGERGWIKEFRKEYERRVKVYLRRLGG